MTRWKLSVSTCSLQWRFFFFFLSTISVHFKPHMEKPIYQMTMIVPLACFSLNHHNRTSCPSSPVYAYLKKKTPYSVYHMSSPGHHHLGVKSDICLLPSFFEFSTSCTMSCALARKFPVDIITHLEATTQVGPSMGTEILKSVDTQYVFPLSRENISYLVTGYTSSSPVTNLSRVWFIHSCTHLTFSFIQAVKCD